MRVRVCVCVQLEFVNMQNLEFTIGKRHSENGFFNLLFSGINIHTNTLTDSRLLVLGE